MRDIRQSSNFMLVQRIEQINTPESANQIYNCKAMCKLCGAGIGQSIEIPRFAIEKGKTYDTRVFCQDSEVIEREMFKALDRNHGPRCKKKIMVVQ